MTSRIARCHCGQLELRCEGEPRMVAMCHCQDCQRRTGSAFGVTVIYVRGDVTVAKGTSRLYERDSDSGFPVKFHFCESCGANVSWEFARVPQVVGVALGAFADPTFPRPQQSVWTKNKHDWLALPPDLDVHDLSAPARSASR